MNKMVCVDCGKPTWECEDDIKRPHMDWIRDDSLQKIIDVLYRTLNKAEARELSQILENYYGGHNDLVGRVNGKQLVIDMQDEQISKMKKVIVDDDLLMSWIRTLQVWYTRLTKYQMDKTKAQQQEGGYFTVKEVVRDMKDYINEIDEVLSLTEEDIHPPRPME